MIKRLFVVLASAWLLAMPALARADVIQSDAGREVINNFDSTITVGKDARLTVKEDIEYDMDDVAHHGLERLIPVTSYVNGENKYLSYDFHLLAVSEDGNSAVKYNLARQDNWYRLRIGDPNVTKTGIHDYTIDYTYGPVVDKTSQGDVLDYNVFGTDWVLPAKKVSATLVFPQDIAINDSLCFSGAVGSRAHDCTITKSGQSLSVVANRELSYHEGIDLQVLLPSGSFTGYVVKTDKPPRAPLSSQDIAALSVGAAIVGSVIILFGSIMITAVRDHRAKKRQTIVPEYEPPDGLFPAEVGMLIDKQFSTKEIVATLVNLAVGGYIRIRETKPKTWLTKAKYEVDLLRPTSEVSLFENNILSLVFNPEQITSKTLPVTAPIVRNSSSKTLPIVLELNKEIKQTLEAKGYLAGRSKFSSKKTKEAVIVTVISFIIMLIVLSILIKSGAFLQAGIGAFFVGASWFFRGEKYTQLGYHEWAKAKGFEWFLTVTEKDRLKFENAPAKTPALFNKLLPYAIALGVEKKWAKQFEDIDLSKASGWYVGSTAGYSAIGLTSDLSSSFSSVVNANVAPSANSGGFGGGGAGGGGGGGGGGGW